MSESETGAKFLVFSFVLGSVRGFSSFKRFSLEDFGGLFACLLCFGFLGIFLAMDLSRDCEGVLLEESLGDEFELCVCSSLCSILVGGNLALIFFFGGGGACTILPFGIVSFGILSLGFFLRIIDASPSFAYNS